MDKWKGVRGFYEGPVNFPPTAKYEAMRDEYSLSCAPMWSDRILVKTNTLKTYDAYDVDVLASPHRPVFAVHELRAVSEPNDVAESVESPESPAHEAASKIATEVAFRFQRARSSKNRQPSNRPESNTVYVSEQQQRGGSAGCAVQ